MNIYTLTTEQLKDKIIQLNSCIWVTVKMLNSISESPKTPSDVRNCIDEVIDTLKDIER